MTSVTEASVSFSIIQCQIGETIVSSDRGLAFGDGIFETLRFEHGNIPLLTYHLARLRRDCQRLKLVLDETSLHLGLEKITREVTARGWNEARVKILVTRGQNQTNTGKGGSYPSQSATAHLYFYISELPKTDTETPVALVSSPVKLPDIKVLAGIKHTNRLTYICGALEVSCKQGQELLFLDNRDNLIETMHHNIFLQCGNTLVTPLIQSCGVTGVMRTLVLEKLAQDIGYQPIEKNINMGDLEHCDGVFICNALYGFTPVSQVDAISLGDSQALCGLLNTALENHYSYLIEKN